MEIWTDGACEPNPGIGGWGWHRCDGSRDCGGEMQTTNNRMEMTAILRALAELPDDVLPGSTVIYSDSQYCVKGLTVWRAGWQRKNWRKKGVDMLNRDLWLELEAQLQRVQPRIEWVKGHNGHAGNEEADQLAEVGRRWIMAREEVAWDSVVSRKGRV